MNMKSALLVLIALAWAGTAEAQLPGGGKVPVNPNRDNLDLEMRQQIQSLDEQRRREAQAGDGLSVHDREAAQAQVAKFVEAIKPRRRRWADFDQVVLHGKTPVTPDMLALMSQSRYAADIAVRQLEATLSGQNVIRK